MEEPRLRPHAHCLQWDGHLCSQIPPTRTAAAGGLWAGHTGMQSRTARLQTDGGWLGRKLFSTQDVQEVLGL